MAIVRYLALVLAFLLSSAAVAEPMSESKVVRFLQSMEELQASESYMEAFLEAVDTKLLEQDQPAALMVSHAVALMGNGHARDVLEQVVRDCGFTDIEAWASTGDRIQLAVMSLGMGDTASALAGELERIEYELKENAHFSDEQKASMRRMIRASSRLLNRVLNVKEADQQAVREHMAELKAALAYSP